LIRPAPWTRTARPRLALLTATSLGIAGSWLLHARHGGGWLLLALAAAIVLATERGSLADPHAPKILTNPPALPEGLLLTAALALGLWSCFSYLDSAQGFHFDVAEFAQVVRARLADLAGPQTRFTQVFRAAPYPALTALLVRNAGFHLWTLRLIGALSCFLTIPALYLAGRILFNRGVAALGPTLFSASLWGFTLSKVATWDAAVPLAATASILLAAWIVKGPRGWLAIPLLTLTLLGGLNLYEAFRLSFPVIALIGLRALPSRRGLARAALLAAAMAAAIAAQMHWFDPLFWERIQQSRLLHGSTCANLLQHGRNLLQGLFSGAWDIYLSPSQGGLDHPLIIGLALTGLALLLANIRHPAAWNLLAWLLLPVAAAWLFEGQWRRGSVAMPAIYLTAALPLARLAALLHPASPRNGSRPPNANASAPAPRKPLSNAFTLTALLALLIAGINVSRFPQIQRHRSGGYYRSPADWELTRLLADRCNSQPVFLITDDAQATVLLRFAAQLQGRSGDCFQPGTNILEPALLGEPPEDVLARALQTLASDSTPGLIAIRRRPALQAAVARLEALAAERATITPAGTPVIDTDYLLCRVVPDGILH
jgi:hypothetical protein